jgi:hypothetical protein
MERLSTSAHAFNYAIGFCTSRCALQDTRYLNCIHIELPQVRRHRQLEWKALYLRGITEVSGILQDVHVRGWPYVVLLTRGKSVHAHSASECEHNHRGPDRPSNGNAQCIVNLSVYLPGI